MPERRHLHEIGPRRGDEVNALGHGRPEVAQAG
jgi:hypothetical protein